MDKLRALCEKDAGMAIYRTVEAEGYYDAYTNNGIVDNLATDNYSFYEFCDDSPSLLKSTAIPEPGCWRVKRVKRSTGLCDERIDRMLAKLVVDPFPKFRETHCVSLEKIDRPTAKYIYRNGYKAWSAEDGIAKFSRTFAQIEVAASGEVLSEYVTYAYNRRPGYTSSRSCSLLDQKFPTFVDSKIVAKTIVYNKENRND